MRVSLLVAVFLIAAARPSHAEGKSEDTAMALSLGGTVVSWSILLGSRRIARGHDDAFVATVATGLAGALIAPSFGHWYAGRGLTKGLQARLVGTAMLAGAAALALQCIVNDEESSGPCHETGMIVLGVAGGIGVLYGTVHDLATARHSARHYNELRLVPVVHSTGGGLSLSGRF
jgi:hypothetical protein